MLYQLDMYDREPVLTLLAELLGALETTHKGLLTERAHHCATVLRHLLGGPVPTEADIRVQADVLHGWLTEGLPDTPVVPAAVPLWRLWRPTGELLYEGDEEGCWRASSGTRPVIIQSPGAIEWTLR